MLYCETEEYCFILLLSYTINCSLTFPLSRLVFGQSCECLSPIPRFIHEEIQCTCGDIVCNEWLTTTDIPSSESCEYCIHNSAMPFTACFDNCQTIAYLIYRSSIRTANQTNINAIHALQITVIDCTF